LLRNSYSASVMLVQRNSMTATYHAVDNFLQPAHTLESKHKLSAVLPLHLKAWMLQGLSNNQGHQLKCDQCRRNPNQSWSSPTVNQQYIAEPKRHNGMAQAADWVSAQPKGTTTT
jgi:hypothetical protein